VISILHILRLTLNIFYG